MSFHIETILCLLFAVSCILYMLYTMWKWKHKDDYPKELHDKTREDFIKKIDEIKRNKKD